MNKYARLAMSHWQRTDPDRYAEIPEPKETFFQQLASRPSGRSSSWRTRSPAATRRTRTT
jgi:hypothetical protein